MLDWLKLCVGALAGAGIAFAAGYMVGNSHGRQSILQSLQSDRVTILKDGKQIDEKAIAADDTALCDLLGGCVVPDSQAH
jgi:hypothetical protein